jgi:hypothetical protein
MRLNRKTLALSIVFSLLSFSFTACVTHHYEGAAAGGAVGGAAGAILDRHNPWRGGVIGAALGAAFGATLADISVRGGRETVDSGRPVEYRTTDRRLKYLAEPLGYDSTRHCRKIRERVWQDARLVRDVTREICESEKVERGHYSGGRHDEDDRTEAGRNGPPSWAPAHGARARHQYRYYPSSRVYFSEERGVYCYLLDGRWHEARRLPAAVRLDSHYVIVELDGDKPYLYHDDIVRKYPPHETKGKKKKKKDR